MILYHTCRTCFTVAQSRWFNSSSGVEDRFRTFYSTRIVSNLYSSHGSWNSCHIYLPCWLLWRERCMYGPQASGDCLLLLGSKASGPKERCERRVIVMTSTFDLATPTTAVVSQVWTINTVVRLKVDKDSLKRIRPYIATCTISRLEYLCLRTFPRLHQSSVLTDSSIYATSRLDAAPSSSSFISSTHTIRLRHLKSS